MEDLEEIETNFMSDFSETPFQIAFCKQGDTVNLTLEEAKGKLKELLDPPGSQKASHHIKIIAGNLEGGIYSERFFIKLLLDAVRNKNHHLSIIACELPNQDIGDSVYKMLQLLEGHKGYKEIVHYFEVKEKLHFESQFKKQLYPAIHIPSYSNDPLFLLFSGDYIWQLSRKVKTDKETCDWEMNTYFSRKNDPLYADDWFDQLWKEYEMKTSPSPIVQPQVQQEKGHSILDGIMNFFSSPTSLK